MFTASDIALLKTKLKRILLLYGNVGEGKTTLVKEILPEFNIVSPTYNLYYQLSNNHETIWHFDFYLNKIDYNILIESFNSPDRIFIECVDKTWNPPILNIWKDEILKITLHNHMIIYNL